MNQTRSVLAPAAPGRRPDLGFHHVGVQTNDLENSLSWYEAFLGCRRSWTLDHFSDLTRSRLPGIRTLTEIVVGEVRLHLFERPGRAPDPAESAVQFQHLCLHVATAEDLARLRQRWIELFRSGRYSYASGAQPTDVVADSDGIQSFYTYDVNGLELEFTYVPHGAP